MADRWAVVYQRRFDLKESVRDTAGSAPDNAIAAVVYPPPLCNVGPLNPKAVLMSAR